MSTSVTQSASQPSSSGSAKSNAAKSNSAKPLITVASVILILLAGFFVIRTQGHVSGSEFSPSHFQTRKFSFYEIPLIHLQITPIYRDSRTPEAATYIRQTGLIPATTGPPVDWHLVRISRGLSGSTNADASFLVDPLKFRFDNQSFWRQWSVDHPNQAAVLWPIIQKLADRELCMLVPELLDTVVARWEIMDAGTKPLATTKAAGGTSSDSPAAAKALRQRIHAYLQQSYVKLIGDMKDAGRLELANDLLAEARSDYPQNETLRAMQ